MRSETNANDKFRFQSVWYLMRIDGFQILKW